MLQKIQIRRGFIFPVFFLLLSNLYAEQPDSSFKKIKELYPFFRMASTTFNIDIKTLESIVFVERTMNFDWKDDALDIPLAESGYNSSIGFCQVKMKTAYWVELQLANSSSEFYPGKSYQNIFTISKSPREIIKKLQNDSLNIHYAAAYIRIIQTYWQKAGFPIAERPDILGTLYSTGLYNSKGVIRKPNKNPQANTFGKKSLEAFGLFSGN